MKRSLRFFVPMLMAALAMSQVSCTAELSSAVRDAAINGTATFVESATTQLLDRWFGASLEE